MSEHNINAPLVEGREYTVECVVAKVAPVRNLHVLWYLGNKVLKSQTYDSSDSSSFGAGSDISLVANRNESGAEIWCEATLVFGARGPMLPSIRSNSVKVEVLCRFLLFLQPIFLNFSEFLLFTSYFTHLQIRRPLPVLKPRSWNSHPPSI